MNEAGAAPRIELGRFVGVFGIRGELKLRATGAGDGGLVAGRSYALDADGARTIVCARARRHQGRWLVTIEGVGDPDAAAPYVGCDVYVERAGVVLAAGEYLDADLAGLRLEDAYGAVLGTVGGVAHLPSQDCLVVEPGAKLVPLVRAFVRSVDVAAGRIVVDLPEGLLD